MKILGIGVDIIDNKRIDKLIKDKKFIQKIFNKQELYFSNKSKIKKNFYAKRFAAKESFSKALGTGIRKDLTFRDITILNDKLGKPFYKKTKKLNDIIYNKFRIKNYNLFLSISDEKDYSIAFTILQKN
jgi:holo-[acyl-carrier protein] synthase